MNQRRGDVVLVDLPQPAGTGGREQFGTRPAIIVQEDTTAANLSTIILVPLTSNLSAGQFPGSFVVTPSAVNGLKVKSVVLTHQVRAIDNRRIRYGIGKLSPQDLEILENELRKLLQL